MRKLVALGLVGLLVSCTPEEPPTQSKPSFTAVRSASSGVAAYRRVAARVEPVAERVCRSMHADKPARFCDFQVNLNNDPREPANAYQTIGKDGRPNITFNINILRSFKNDHEIAFVFGHEAGHQIASHIQRTAGQSGSGRACPGRAWWRLRGAMPLSAWTSGTAIGGRAYSKKFELQADTIAAHIADRSGYNAALGAKTFERTGGSSALFCDPPSVVSAAGSGG